MKIQSIREYMPVRRGRPPASRTKLVPALFERLKRQHGLAEADIEMLADLCASGLTSQRSRTAVVQTREPGAITVILDGWACRARTLVGQRRQIVALMLPGDIRRWPALAPDESIIPLSPMVYGHIGQERADELIAAHSNVRRVVEHQLLLDLSIVREWLVSAGRRNATERVAHLFSELAVRRDAELTAQGAVIDLPITQIDVADMLGLTPVHVNRVLRQLRAQSLVDWKERRLTIRDVDGLARLSGFDPAYLRPGPRAR